MVGEWCGVLFFLSVLIVSYWIKELNCISMAASRGEVFSRVERRKLKRLEFQAAIMFDQSSVASCSSWKNN